VATYFVARTYYRPEYRYSQTPQRPPITGPLSQPCLWQCCRTALGTNSRSAGSTSLAHPRRSLHSLRFSGMSLSRSWCLARETAPSTRCPPADILLIVHGQALGVLIRRPGWRPVANDLDDKFERNLVPSRYHALPVTRHAGIAWTPAALGPVFSTTSHWMAHTGAARKWVQIQTTPFRPARHCGLLSCR